MTGEQPKEQDEFINGFNEGHRTAQAEIEEWKGKWALLKGDMQRRINQLDTGYLVKNPSRTNTIMILAFNEVIQRMEDLEK